MSVFLDAARLITSLGSLDAQLIGLDNPNLSGEYLAASVSSMSADTIAAGFVGYKWFRQAELEGPIGHGEASIILKTLAIVDLLELQTGFGPPCEGDDLKAGSRQFITVYEQLGSAFPDDNWEGAASQAYADRNADQQDRAQTMADLDLQLADIVKNQADWVTQIRLGFGILKDLLIAAFAIELAIKTSVPPPGGVAAAQAFATVVSVAMITNAMGLLTTLLTFSIINAEKADDLTTKYTEVAAGAIPTGALAQTEVPAAGQSTVSSVEAICSSMSGPSAMADMPRLASESTFAEQRAPLSAASPSALMDDGETPRDDTPGETPEETTPATPAFTMPRLTQLMQMSAQASQPMNLVNQMIGQVQQLASMAQQGQGAAAPAEDPTHAEDVDGARAAVGIDGVERGPIELATVGATQAPKGLI